MRQKLKKSMNVFFFITIFVFILCFCSLIFIPKSNAKGAGMKDISANGILGEKENSIDILIFGDSESYFAFSPMAMYDEYGFTSYVCGTSGQPLYYTKSLLDRTLKSQKPKIIIMETNAIFRTFLASDFMLEKLGDILPIFKYHDRWKNLKIDDLTKSIKYSYIDVMKGYHYTRDIRPVNDTSKYMVQTDGIESIPYLNQLILNEIVKKCKEDNIELLLVSTPSTVNWNTKKHKSIKQYASKQNIKYIDLNLKNLEEPIDWQKDTGDAGDHMNFTGAMKVTKFIGKYINKNYSLSDHRSDKEYEKWNEELIEYKEIISN